MQSLTIHKLVSKKLRNQPIYLYNHELKSIVVNKGQIHGEIREFFRYFLNSITLDNEFR